MLFGPVDFESFADFVELAHHQAEMFLLSSHRFLHVLQLPTFVVVPFVRYPFPAHAGDKPMKVLLLFWILLSQKRRHSERSWKVPEGRIVEPVTVLFIAHLASNYVLFLPRAL